MSRRSSPSRPSPMRSAGRLRREGREGLGEREGKEDFRERVRKCSYAVATVGAILRPLFFLLPPPLVLRAPAPPGSPLLLPLLLRNGLAQRLSRRWSRGSVRCRRSRRP